MKILLILSSLCLTFLSYSQAWNQIDDFSGSPRDDGAGFKIGDAVYFGTGLDNSFITKPDFYAFDLNNETWTQISSLPIGKERQYATGANYNNAGYLFGGIDANGNYLNDFWKYDPTTDTWTELTSLPSFGRSGMVNFVVNNLLYIIGGKSLLYNSIGEVWSYDFSSGNWVQKNDVGITEIWRGIGVQLNNIGYIGYGKKNDGSFNDRLFTYDIATDSWSENPSLATLGRAYPAYSTIDNELYIYGGELDDGSYSNDFMRFNPSLNTLTNLNSFTSDARRGAYAFSSNNDFYLTTGVTVSNRTNETWKSGYVIGLVENQLEDLNINITNHKIMGLKNLKKSVSIEIRGMDGRLIYYKTNIHEDFNHNIKVSGSYFIHILNTEINFKSTFFIL